MSERRIIQSAFAISLLLHLVLAVVTWHIPLFPQVDPSAHAANTDDVQMIFVPPDTPQKSDPESNMPKSYTEVPDRQASETPPDQADYLALHHSLAADNVMGGEGDKPSADKEWISDQVQIKREDLAGAQGLKVTEARPEALPAPEGQRADQQSKTDAAQPKSERESNRTPGAGQWALADPQKGAKAPSETAEDPRSGEKNNNDQELEKWWNSQQPSILKQGKQGSQGDRGFDFDQAARGKVTSGVAIDGDFSLNTYEWDYAPWMHRFTNELYRHWVPPYAYKLGILTGHTVIKLVIARDGRITSLDVIETEGHESLHEASVDALKAFAPYAPLPAHFPEENLVITLGLYYPALHR